MSLAKKTKLALKLAWAVIKLIRNPNDISPIFNVGEFKNHMSFRQALAKARADSELNALFNERYRSPKIHDMNELLQLPANSLGYTFAKHMQHWKMDVVFYPEIDDPTNDDITYLRMRSRETHDIHHAVLGMKPDHLGEMSISAFYLAQLTIPLSAVLLGVGFLVATIKKPWMIERLVESIIQGWNLGKKSKQILAVKWEEQWHRPVDEVRAELGLDIKYETWQLPHQREIEKIEKAKLDMLLNEKPEDQATKTLSPASIFARSYN